MLGRNAEGKAFQLCYRLQGTSEFLATEHMAGAYGRSSAQDAVRGSLRSSGNDNGPDGDSGDDSQAPAKRLAASSGLTRALCALKGEAERKR